MARIIPMPSRADEFDDLLDDEEDAGLELFASDEDGESDEGIELDFAISEVQRLVKDAVDFMNSEFVPQWERAEEFMNGETDLTDDEGRSKVVDTVLRDTVRAVKPNIMRVFSETTSIVQYLPAVPLNFAAATVAEAQTTFAHQLFWSSGGYLALLNNAHNCLLKKFGVFKASHSDYDHDKYYALTNVDQQQLQELQQMPDVQITSAEADGVTGLFRVELLRRCTTGKLTTGYVDLLNFFIDDNATGVDDATIIGERTSTTVGYAKSLGLEYDDWESLDDFDPEDDGGSGDAEERRGYTKSMELEKGDDLSNKRILLTEAYAKFDLDGTGVAQLYRFWLGGQNYEYIDHDRVEDNPYAIAQIDPVPGAFAGKSFFDILKDDQNVQTSLLRATVDNAHLSTNRRLAVHDTLVNMQDVMSKKL